MNLGKKKPSSLDNPEKCVDTSGEERPRVRILSIVTMTWTWTQDHPEFTLAKTELLAFPASQLLHKSADIQIIALSLAPNRAVRTLGVMIDDQLEIFGRVASNFLEKTKKSGRS